MNNKILIYQIFTRLFGNRNTTRKQWGTIAENGSGKFNDFDQKTLKHIKKMGFSHVWYTGVIRHATQTDYSQYGIPRQHPAVIKGRAGSPYAIADYYDVDPDLAENVDRRMKEFEALVARTHKAGMKVIIDFVPNHVARQYHSTEKPDNVSDLGADDISEHGFDPQNNFYYCPGCSFDPRFNLRTGAGKGDLGQDVPEEEYTEYPAKATGNDHFDNQPGQDDWYETVKLNYGVDYWTGIGHFEPIPDTWKKMTDILLFWAAKGVDGFRCDMAEMVPSAFWAWATEKVKYRYPEMIFIGEVYDPNQYRRYINAGFDYLYDKVGMYDTMRAAICGYGPARNITYAWQSTNDIKDNMLYFLENHDEQRVASDFFAGCAFKAVPALAVSLLLRRNPFMLFEGEEYGEKGMDAEGFSGRDGRTTIFDYWSIDTLCRASKFQLTPEETRLSQIHSSLIGIARNETAVSEGDFFDLMYVNPWSDSFNPNRHYTFLRRSGNTLLVVLANFDSQPASVRINIPAHAFDYLRIPEGPQTATELLTGEKSTFHLAKDGAIAASAPAYGVSVYKITF